MTWNPPKTDWADNDCFELDPDWNRITGNLETLRAQARPVFGPLAWRPMPALTAASLPYPDVLQTVEDNTETLRQAVALAARLPKKRQVEDNGPVWDAHDLNRLEKNALELERLVFLSAQNRPTLALTLGGGIFAQGI